MRESKIPRRTKQPPKPGVVGGRLIRRLIGELRTASLDLPLKSKTSHILIATSGGSDSVALAALAAKYGHRVGARSKILLLHLNHGWRGKASDDDARFVRALAKRLGVRCTVKKVKLPGARLGKISWEDYAREQRKAFYAAELAKLGAGAFLLTAHHADDLAETVLWRLLTGGAKTHGGGIARRHGQEIRPLLTTRKAELRAFLEEEQITWREDKTNHEGRFLRSRMRSELVPVLEKIFPRAVEHLVRLGLAAQAVGADSAPAPEGALILLGAAGIRPRRPHWEHLAAKPGSALDLPGGWRLTREGSGTDEKWLLQRCHSAKVKRLRNTGAK